MTFKHDNNSELMRSLEKVAREKGLVKPEAIQKKAATTKKADVIPTSNLMENIFKLCAAMRTQGLESEALEVEMNYLNLKRAQTLYETSKETGDSLLQSAHPDGSHKMENVEGDEATFEDLLDKHVKIMQVVEKKPHGKLSSAAQITNAVKIVLSEGVGDTETKKTDKQYKASILQAMNVVRTNLRKIGDISDKELTFNVSSKYIDPIIAWTNYFDDQGTPTIDSLKTIQKDMGKLRSRLDPSGWLHYATFGSSGLSEDTWTGIEGLLKETDDAIKDAINSRTSLRQQQSNEEIHGGIPNSSTSSQLTDAGKPSKQNFVDRLNNLNRNLALYQSYLPVRIAPSAQKQASDIIKNYKVQIDALLAYLKDASDQEATSKLGAIDQLEKWITDFATSWRLA